MKTLTILFSAILIACFAFNSSATIRSVCNSPSVAVAQFSTINDAIAASASGDTIYVHGSPVNYAGFTLTSKRLAIIGPGWSPDKNLAFTANVAGGTITGAACTNTEIQGIVFTTDLNMNSSHPDSLRIIRNKFQGNQYVNEGSTVYKGYLFEGNIFSGSNCYVTANASSTYLNFVFQNNYFFKNHNQNIQGFSNSLNTVLFDHNLWFGGNVCFDNCQFLIITNNIFVERDAATGNSNSAFSNNITYNATNNTPWNSNGNIDAGGNISNTDPQMAAQAAVDAGSDNPLNDFTIAAGPSNNAGSDGKDIGLLYDVTGNLNWVNSRNSRLPRIFSFSIANPTIPSGGTLNITVEGRKSN